MPLRVRCRCGQELTVRYSEWIYVFLGAALLVMVLNTVALVLLYFRIDGLTRAQVALSGGSVSEPVAASQGAAKEAARAPAPPSPSRKESAEPRAEAAVITRPNSRPPDSTRDLAPTPVPPLPPAEPPVLPVDNSLKHALEGSEAITPGDRPGSEPLVAGGRLVRLYLLESTAGESAARIAAALLLDEDPRLQRRALDRLLRLKAERGVGNLISSSPEIAELVGRATAWLEKAHGGRELLNLVKSRGPGQSDSPVDGTASKGITSYPTLLKIRAECTSVLSRSDAQAVLRLAESAAATGLDVVLAVDVSQSMAGALEALQRDALWLLPALTWALPGVRVGALFYRDGVESTLDFSIAPEGEILRALREAKAEGGGDVQEGVHTAIGAALSLGKFHWRSEAAKNIVIVGDAPPPFDSKGGLLALLKQARLQGQFRAHAVSVNPEEGRASVPMFPDIAQAGGGVAVTVTDLSQLGSEVFLAAMPPEAQASLRALLPALKGLFHGDAM